MRAGERFRRARIDDEPLFHALLKVLRLEHVIRGRRHGPAGEEVHFLHVREIGRTRHLLRELVLDELLAAFLEDGIGALLDADRRIVAVGNVAAARRARAVGRVQQRLVAQRRDLAVHRVVENARVLAGLLRVGQIGAAGIADEQRIPRERAPALLAGIFYIHRVGHALRRVPRRLERDDARRPDLELLAVLQLHVGVAEELVAAAHDLRAGQSGEVARAEFVILLPVGLEHVGDGEIVLPRETQVFVDVPPRVDDHGEAFAAADHVRVLPESRGFQTLEEHYLSPRTRAPRKARARRA